MGDRFDRETPRGGSTLPRELQLIVDDAWLGEPARAERNGRQCDGSPQIDPAWLSDDPALD
jgi:hypothetical protein